MSRNLKTYILHYSAFVNEYSGTQKKEYSGTQKKHHAMLEFKVWSQILPVVQANKNPPKNRGIDGSEIVPTTHHLGFLVKKPL